MAEMPDQLDRRQHVERPRRVMEAWIRRAGIALLSVFLLLGLLDVFGQRPVEVAVSSKQATLTLSAPEAIRGGLIYEARFRIDALQALERPALVLDPGWFDGFTITVDPDPLGWTQREGRNIASYGRIPAGRNLTVRLHVQVNPTAVGRRRQNVTLEDAGHRVLALEHTAFVYP